MTCSLVSEPTVNVIIPTYKGAHSVGRAVESVLSQDYGTIEILVVDDNDPTSEARVETEHIMRRYEDMPQVHYVKHERNMNGSAARNTGISMSGGKYVCFLDDDDVYAPSRVSKSVEAMEEDPDVSLLLCDVLHIFDVERHMNRYQMNVDEITVEGILLNEAAIGTGSNLFARKECVNAIEGFDVRFQRHQDLEFAIRLIEEYPKVCVLSDPLVIKGFNGVNNVPKYESFSKVKNLYNQVFKEEIDSLPEQMRSRYWRTCNMSLFRSALRSNDCYHARKHLDDACAHGQKKTMKNLLQLTLARCGLFSLLIKEGNAATLSNGTNAELTYGDALKYYDAMGEKSKERCK